MWALVGGGFRGCQAGCFQVSGYRASETIVETGTSWGQPHRARSGPETRSCLGGVVGGEAEDGEILNSLGIG